MSRIVLISGSPTAPSKSAFLLDHASNVLLSEYGLSTTQFSVRDFPAEDLIAARYDSPAFDTLKKEIEEADGIVVATPIYKASYTGSLKTLLDVLPQNALKSKTVLPLATGGTISHLLAIDYALKPVLAVLGASDIHQGVFFVDSQFQKTAGGLELDPELKDRFDDSLHRLAVAIETERLAAVA